MNYTDASIPFGNAQLSCRGSARHMRSTSHYRGRTGWFCQSIFTAKVWTAKQYEVVFSAFEVKKWKLLFYFLWKIMKLSYSS